MTDSRQPKGIPVGGQFAATAHAEPGVVLSPAASPVEIDTRLTELWLEHEKVERSFKRASKPEAMLEKKASLQELDERIEELEAGYYKQPWNRYFLVPNGHLHSSNRCGSLQDSTRIGLVPALSGKDEGSAVAEEGRMLCSHCFPDAPSEWTKPAAVDPDLYCPGSGEEPAERRRGNTSWMDGLCPECGEWQRGVAVGVRKHRRRKTK